MRRSRRARAVNTRTPRATTLIICEGEKTEPLYFQAILEEYKLTNAVVIQGASGDPSHILKIAKREKANYESIWCVFDRDSFPAADFDNTIHSCLQTKGFHAAWSNESFELWYVLHFQYLNTAPQGSLGNARSYYIERLKTKECLGSYQKNNSATWQTLKEKLPIATRNAHRLIQAPDASLPFHLRVPVTHVVDLVEALISYGEFREVEDGK
jgi:hypothetical protein